MNTYKRHRFPPDTILYAVWLYYRLNLSHRDIEGFPAERGIPVTRVNPTVVPKAPAALMGQALYQVRCAIRQKIETKVPGLWRYLLHR
ncbi:Uncharacterised protein [Halioglobus japonicus]|nr:Uncharacterised protein [Halioglobus japonicus]